jgi:hypothetical protein
MAVPLQGPEEVFICQLPATAEATKAAASPLATMIFLIFENIGPVCFICLFFSSAECEESEGRGHALGDWSPLKS